MEKQNAHLFEKFSLVVFTWLRYGDISKQLLDLSYFIYDFLLFEYASYAQKNRVYRLRQRFVG